MEIYFGLGSNLGDRKANVLKAVAMLDEALGCRYSRISSLIETEPWGFECENGFINCVVVYDIENQQINPFDTLKLCKRIESIMGRRENVEYDEDGRRIYHSRTIDIDILLMDTLRVDTEQLTIPHKLMSQRDFVMNPLSEVISPRLKEHFPEIFTNFAGCR